MCKRWNDEEINEAINMVNQGKNFKEIGLILNKSQISVNNKLNRLGYKSGYKPEHTKGKTKYDTYDWTIIQREYDNGLSYHELLIKFKIGTHAVIWAKKNNVLKLRTNSEGLKLAWRKGKFAKSNQIGIKRYRQLCDFKFSLNEYPNKFDFDLIRKHGWYSAKNRGNNVNGVCRDHMYSIKEGYLNNVEPTTMSHPANCKLVLHIDNIKKKSNCSITLEELLIRIEDWNIR